MKQRPFKRKQPVRPAPHQKPEAPWVPATFTVIFEGDGLLVVDKPAGLPTHRTSDARRPNLFDALLVRYPGASLLHRLDADTSGILLFTTDRTWNAPLAELFETGGIDKTYVAIVRGPHDLKASWTTKSYIARARRRQNVYHSIPDAEAPRNETAKVAETRFRSRPAKPGFFEIQATPITGRPHQIRVHLAEDGLPIVGDHIYHGMVASRLMLHARSLEFTDPRSARRLRFEAPLPPEIKDYMQKSSAKHAAQHRTEKDRPSHS